MHPQPMKSGHERGAIVLNRREPSLSGEALPQLAALWLADCADRLDDLMPDGSFGDTTKGYERKLIYFLEWWQEAGPACGYDLTQRGLREFERWLRSRLSRYDKPLSYHTRADALRRLQQMFRWAEVQGYIEGVMPSAWVPSPVGDPPVRQEVSDSDLVALLGAAAKSSQPLRNLAILATLIGTGVRRTECAMLRVEDVEIHATGAGVLTVRHPKRTKRGAKPRTAAFDVETGRHLANWLDCLGGSGPLWPNKKTGAALSSPGLYKAVKKCWLDAGLSTSQPCHDLRSKFISNWRRVHRGSELDDLLQRMVGHAGSAMTNHYTTVSEADLVAVATSPMVRIGAEIVVNR